MNIPFKETATTCLCVAILCALGTWQVQRLQWKEKIIAELESAYAQKNSQDLAEGLLGEVDSGDNYFAYGTVRGHLLKDKAVLVGPSINDGRSGYHLLIPIMIREEKQPLIVNAGWVSDLWNDTLEERLATLPQDVTVRGLVRYPDYSRFTSKNSPENDLWFSANPEEIAHAKDIPAIYKIILYADNIDPPLQDVLPNEEKWEPRNKHLQYAIFWYAMAVVMLGVYGVYVYGRNKSSNQQT